MTGWRDLVVEGVLVCPADHGALIAHESDISCSRCARRYRIDNDIPVLLLSDAIEPDPVEN